MRAHRSGHLRRDTTKRPGPQRVAVLGGGPAGLAAAHTLAHAEVEVEVYEAAPHVGGLGQSFDLWGWRVDVGSHIYAEGQPLADALFAASVGNDAHRVPLRRGILIAGRCYTYPLQRKELALRAPKVTVLRGATEYTAHYLANRTFMSARNAQEYMIGRFGKTLSETFFRSYVEKLYGRPWNEIDPEFARALTTSTARRPAPRDVPVPVERHRRDRRGHRRTDRRRRWAHPYEQPGAAHHTARPRRRSSPTEPWSATTT